ncbi:MAG: ATP-dependent RecD-like DNA helicase [Clostridiaceae bacterium]|nr:ATP-dependent RecD-like DNA helicase [Clostridiaceae bacterium]
MVVIEGTVENIIFSNEANGYMVCEIACKCDGLGLGLVTVVGYMPFITPGEILRIRGIWTTHPDYGDQVKVEYYEKVMPETAEAIERYLAAGVIKGIGKATAKKIVGRFGEESLKIMLEQPEKLAEIKGISLSKALEIGQALVKHREFTRIVAFLYEHGISPAYTAKIYKIYGDNTIEEIRKNPYKLVDEIQGISFKTADRIAATLGIDPRSELRVCSGVKYVLVQAAANGHTYLPQGLLEQYSQELLDASIENIRNALSSMVFNDSIYIEKDNENESRSKIYQDEFYKAEIGVAMGLLALSGYGCRVVMNNGRKHKDAGDGENDGRRQENEDNEGNGMDEIMECLEYIRREDGITLAAAQRQCIIEALANNVLVITGGPGTGKTTIIKSIIHILKEQGCRIVLAAPTGRAAKRMTEATGFEAKTIHRLLEVGFMGEDEKPVFLRNETNPLDADVIIVDEMSMVDILLMNHLVKAVKPGAKLIMVGDVDQLPSVGPGNVLKDIIASRTVKTVRLTEVFRQSEESMIVVNAHKVNRGEMPLLNTESKDFFYIQRDDAAGIVGTIVELCNRRIPSQFGYDPVRDIQVLTPTKKGYAGVANLNLELQKKLNPRGPGKMEKEFPGFTYRKGDKVMQIKNNYNVRWVKQTQGQKRDVGFSKGPRLANAGTGDESGVYMEGLGVFNGDMGIIEDIDNEREIITVVFDEDRVVEYSYDAFDEIEPAYAITIHKSQGSEFPVVILPVFPGPPVLMTRNLLYTAITRARDMVVIVGMKNMLHFMVNNHRETLRYSGLMEKLARHGAQYMMEDE